MAKRNIRVLYTKHGFGHFQRMNQKLQKTCSLALQQPIKNKQVILMTDASFTAAGYAIMIEDDPSRKIQSRRKTYAPTYAPT